MLYNILLDTCPVRRGVSAASFDATGLGVRTGQVCEYNENRNKKSHV